jgi:hypothetical protein
MIAIYLILTAVNVPGGPGMTGTQVNNAGSNYINAGVLPNTENINTQLPPKKVKASYSRRQF